MRFAVSAVFAVSLIQANGCSAGTITSKNAVISSRDAVSRGIQYTGFGNTDAVHSELVESAGLSSVIPFIAVPVSHKLWRLRFENIRLAAPNPRSAGRLFNVCLLLDAVEGQLVAVDAVPAPNDACVQSRAAASSDESDLRKLGERYTSLPLGTPAVTFVQAARILGNLQYATGVHALYVLDTSTAHPQPRAIWSLIVVGLPPIQPKGGDPHYVNTSSEPLRYGVDAQTGKEIFMTNVL